MAWLFRRQQHPRPAAVHIVLKLLLHVRVYACVYEINGRLITLWKNAFIFSRVKAYFSRKKEGGRERKKCRNEEKIVLIAPDLLKTEISHIPIFTSFISLSFTLSVSLSTTEAAAAAGKGRERHIFWYHLFFLFLLFFLLSFLPEKETR